LRCRSGASSRKSLKSNADSSSQDAAAWVSGLLALLFFLLSGAYLVDYLKANAASEACTFFTQSIAICKPYIDDHESKVLESRFASIRGRADYMSVMDELRQIAASKSLQLPDFNPW
jgi:hypothetical protein